MPSQASLLQTTTTGTDRKHNEHDHPLSPGRCFHNRLRSFTRPSQHNGTSLGHEAKLATCHLQAMPATKAHHPARTWSTPTTTSTAIRSKQWIMAHNWEDHSTFFAIKRVCTLCGATQIYDLVSYDRIMGSTWRWVPRAGRCPNKQTHHASETIEGMTDTEA